METNKFMGKLGQNNDNINNNEKKRFVYSFLTSPIFFADPKLCFLGLVTNFFFYHKIVFPSYIHSNIHVFNNDQNKKKIKK